MKFRSSFVASAAASVLLMSLSGCPGHLDDDLTGTAGTGGGMCTPNNGTTTPPATFATVKMAMSDHGAVSACASAPCHGANGMAPPVNPLTLQQDANLYMNMMTYVSKACDNLPLINPGKPNESALIKILSGPCGATFRMPYGCTGEQCLSDAEIAAISQWIANCAPEQ